MQEKKILWEEQPSFVRWNRIKALRRARKMTRLDLALESGVSTTYIQNIEHGLDNGVSLEIREKIAAALDVPVNAIFPVRMQGMTVIETGEKLTPAKSKK